MSGQICDIVVVGAGPAGLSAARTAARLGFKTIVVERLAEPGDLAHPCAATLAPIPGFVSVQESAGDVYFPEIDFRLPSALVRGRLAYQRLVSPGGFAHQAPFSTRTPFPVVTADKPRLLRQLATEAAAAGAELRYNTAAIGLAYDGERVSGVRTGDGTIEAGLVLAAEGTARQLAGEAGLFARIPCARRFAFVVSQEYDAWQAL